VNLRMTKQALKFVDGIDKKQKQQISNTIISLMSQPTPHDSSVLHGAKNGERRVDVGEYRVIYTYEKEIVSILVIGKRNDDSVYKIWKQQVS